MVGKGAVEYWAAVKPGRIMFEVEEFFVSCKRGVTVKSFQ
jgi:ribosomal protein L16/L10AE